jgi:hypothetical protein
LGTCGLRIAFGIPSSVALTETGGAQVGLHRNSARLHSGRRQWISISDGSLNEVSNTAYLSVLPGRDGPAAV